MSENAVGKLQQHDDYLSIQKYFGGFFAVTHTVSVALFFAPYVIFLLYAGLSSGYQHNTDLTVGEAVVNFVLTQGKDIRGSAPINWFSVGTVALFSVYNLIRLSFVGVAEKLKIEKVSSSAHPPYDLIGWRGTAFKIVRFTFVIYLIATLLNALGFLNRPISSAVIGSFS